MSFGMSTLPEAVLLARYSVAGNTASQYRYCNVASNTASGRVDVF